MQLTPFARFYALTLFLSLAIQFPLVILGMMDTGTAPYAHGMILVALCLAPWAAARITRVPPSPDMRRYSAPPSIFLLGLLACAATVVALAGHGIAVAAGWSAVDWTLDTLMIRIGRPERYGLSELPPPSTLFVVGFVLSMAIGGAIAGLLCHAVIAVWFRYGLPAFSRLGSVGSGLACGAAAALPWAPLAFGTAPTSVGGLVAALRFIAFAAVMGLLALAIWRRSGNLILGSAAVGFAVVAGAVGWSPLFPDAPPMVAGPAGVVPIGLWALAALALVYVPTPKFVRRAVPAKPRTKADLLADRPADIPAATMAEPAIVIEESPVKVAPNRKRAAPGEVRKRKPPTKTKTPAKRAPAKKKSGASAPKKKASVRKPKSR